MFDFGWVELFVIMALAVFVIGPDELPALMLGLGRIVRRLQYVKYALSQQFEEFMQQSDLQDLQRSVNFEAQSHTEKASSEYDMDPSEFDEAYADEDMDGPYIKGEEGVENSTDEDDAPALKKNSRKDISGEGSQ